MWIWVARLALAAGSGLITYASFEPIGWWLAGIVGIALFFVSLVPWGKHRPSMASGALLGFIHGFVLYLLLLPWIGEFVGNLPYVALALACALYAILTGLVGVAIARWPVGWVLFPFWYVAVEFARSSWPFGGFSWVRLGWGQINGPLVDVAKWGGPALVTFVTALVATGLVALACRSQRIPAASVIVVIFAASLLTGLTVNRPQHTTDTVEVAAIQGNVPRMGLDFNAQRRAVLENHVRVTKEMAASGAEPDLVIWPENASDVNPFTDAQARQLVEESVAAADAPLLVGTITQDEVGARNTMQVFDPETGPGDYHHKIYLQPFGEYMPYRDFFRNFSEYVDLAGDFKPGDGPGVVRMGNVVVGVATCYEVAFDPAYRDAVKNGAQILTTPTNNATFGFTDMTYQQLAMSRLRAIETDRAVVVVATSGVSAIVHPDGTVSQHTGMFEPGYLVESLPLRDSVTFAVRYGHWVEWVLVIIGVVAGLFAVFTNRHPRTATRRTRK